MPQLVVVGYQEPFKNSAMLCQALIIIILYYAKRLQCSTNIQNERHKMHNIHNKKHKTQNIIQKEMMKWWLKTWRLQMLYITDSLQCRCTHLTSQNTLDLTCQQQQIHNWDIGSLQTTVVVWRSGSAFVYISKVNLHRARLVLGWVTVSSFNSQCRTFISVCNQPPRPTQPSILLGSVNED